MVGNAWLKLKANERLSGDELAALRSVLEGSISGLLNLSDPAHAAVIADLEVRLQQVAGLQRISG